MRQTAIFRRYGWIVFVFFALVGTAFGVFPGGWFEANVDQDATLVTTSYGIVAVVLTIAIAVTAFRRGELWVWLAFWVWPLFFSICGFAFFAFDFVFALLAPLTLAATYPSSRGGTVNRPKPLWEPAQSRARPVCPSAAHIEGMPIGTIGGMSGRCTDRFTAVVELSRVVAAAKLHDPER